MACPTRDRRNLPEGRTLEGSIWPRTDRDIVAWQNRDERVSLSVNNKGYFVWKGCPWGPITLKIEDGAEVLVWAPDRIPVNVPRPEEETALVVTATGWPGNEGLRARAMLLPRAFKRTAYLGRAAFVGAGSGRFEFVGLTQGEVYSLWVHSLDSNSSLFVPDAELSALSERAMPLTEGFSATALVSFPPGCMNRRVLALGDGALIAEGREVDDGKYEFLGLAKQVRWVARVWCYQNGRLLRGAAALKDGRVVTVPLH